MAVQGYSMCLVQLDLVRSIRCILTHRELADVGYLSISPKRDGSSDR